MNVVAFIIQIIVFVLAVLILLGIVWHIYSSNMFGNRSLKMNVQRPEPSKWPDDGVTASWLGHAAVMLNIFGIKIIIDPALEGRIGVTPFRNLTIGPKRFSPPGLKAEDVGNVDIILVSHAHTDHFDFPTIRKLQSPKTTVVAAKKMEHFLKGMDFKQIIELDWGEKILVDGVEIRALEGRHWGERLPWHKDFDANSYLISKNGVNIFFGGDTAYTKKFARQLKGIPIDLAFVGIGAYSPKSFQNRHASPEQAWKMAKEIGAKQVVPIHWGAFKLSQEPMDEPIRRFMTAAGDEAAKVPIREVGQTVEIRSGK